jgi:primosomal protein N' (replication factor Y)
MPAMLRLATRAPGLGDPPSMRKVYRLGQGEPDRMTRARAKRCWRTLADMAGWASRSELAELAASPTSVVKGLVKQGAWSRRTAPRDCPSAARPDLPART